MKTNIITILLLNFLVALNCSYATPKECKEDSSLECIYSNFDELYTKDYERFWRILNASAEKAANCKNIKNTTEFIELTKISSNNAEFNEFINQQLEELCVNHNACFFKSLLKTDTETAKIIVQKLKNPLFVDKKELDKVFKKYRSNPKFKYLTDVYFSK